MKFCSNNCDNMHKYRTYFRNILKHFQNNQGQNLNLTMNSRKIPHLSGNKVNLQDAQDIPKLPSP